MSNWYALPFDEGIPKFAPPCADGDEIDARLSDGSIVRVTVERHRGCHFIGPDGEAVEPEAIRTPPPEPRRETRTEADMAERYDTIKLRLPRGDKSRLERLAETEGMSSAKLVSAWIDRAERELRALERR